MERLSRKCHRVADSGRSSCIDCVEAGIPEDLLVEDYSGCGGAQLVRLGQLLLGISPKHGFWGCALTDVWMGYHASVTRIVLPDLVPEGIEGSETDTVYCIIARVDRCGAADCGMLSMAA